ncbi:TIGR02444 family protein [Motilimonas eburnea]|uniref:TIGR02444 family protein n=1 Tax=Motilimonas eburnea TaxID=1737488 RepID=UPI001E3F49FD|nr:TIGR02444 family protein [Motilimonas eburnea]MCE2570118.1 TIGR02444 family protein [Motilimonas eburnea]
MMNKPASPLWQQCERLYDATHGPALLKRQASHGCSVNLMLLARYLDQNQHPLPQAIWHQLDQHAEHFERRILRPYRLCRQQLKARISQGAYQGILTIELVLERALQQQLAILLPLSALEAHNEHRTGPISFTNLCRYARARNIPEELLTPIFQ